MARRTNDADCVRQNRVVLAPVAGVKLRGGEVNPTGLMSRKSANDGGKTNSSPGRARHKPSNHCAGNAGVLRLYLYARVRFFAHPCTRDRGCSKHPAFPAPSLSREGRGSCKTRARACREKVSTCFIRHCERSEAIHSFLMPHDGLLRCARNDGERAQRTGPIRGSDDRNGAHLGAVSHAHVKSRLSASN